ncbi:MAG: hypothetical protein HXY20_11375 [Acidobacteria bacterium]|nr:hypothetical protein [Acidobacteriota bacterium]
MNRRDQKADPARVAVFFGLFAALTAFPAVSGAQNGSTARPDWSRIRGVNYIPSYARSSSDMWQNYDADTVDRELGFVKGLGLNSVRVFLHFYPYEKNPAGALAVFGDFLNRCRRHGLTVLPVFFDSCGLDPRPDAVEMSAADAYAHFIQDPALPSQTRKRLEAVYREFALGRGKAVRVPIGKTTPVDVFIWRWWSPSPGYASLGREHWPALERYVAAALARGAGSPEIIAWEIMNEPGTLMDLPAGVCRQEAESRLDGFLAHFSDFIRKRAGPVPMTIGAENLDRMKRHEALVELLSIHSYDEPAELKAELEAATEWANQKRKPLLITECLANTRNWLTVFAEERLATDEGQLDHYRRILPLLMDSGLGWYSWGFVSGQMFGTFTHIVHPDGYRRPAAMFLEETLRAAQR